MGGIPWQGWGGSHSQVSPHEEEKREGERLSIYTREISIALA